jgi:hypothetical protein
METRAEELFYDSEATLRLVDTVLDELQVMEEEVSRSEDRVRFLTEQVGRAHAGIADLPEILSRAYVEIQSVLESLRRSRSVLERSTVDKFQHMNDRLREVSSATESAATDILDGVDRALALVDHLDTEEDGPDRTRGFAELRNELFGVMGCMQFQDITAQQLGYAASVLNDIEGRLTELARIFDPSVLGRPGLPLGPTCVFDPGATTHGAAHRQAIVDEIFGTARE